MCIKGNGGTLNATKRTYVKNYGEVWFDEWAITNILSFSNVKKQFHISYDDSNGSVFKVHKPDGTTKDFMMHADGLHYHDTKGQQLVMLNTVKQNE